MNAILKNNESFQSLQRMQQAIADIKQGKMVVMVDDEDRENEGDLVYASTFSTPQKVNFMASEAKGLICVSLTQKIADRLNLAPMVKNNNSSYETAFTVSVDAVEASTGISAVERDMTIKILSHSSSCPSDLVRPGHIFPLIAKEGGALERIGHTEGSVDLCRLAGVGESAVICEIMKEDGSMARRPDLDIFCEKHKLNIVYISDIVRHRMMNEHLIWLVSEASVEFMRKPARKYDYLDHKENHHSVFLFGDIKSKTPVKFHNVMEDAILFNDIEKYENLMKSIAYLAKNGGALIFMRNEPTNMDQVREYGIGAQIVRHLGIEEIELITESEEIDFVGIFGFGLKIASYIRVSKN